MEEDDVKDEEVDLNSVTDAEIVEIDGIFEESCLFFFHIDFSSSSLLLLLWKGPFSFLTSHFSLHFQCKYQKLDPSSITQWCELFYTPQLPWNSGKKTFPASFLGPEDLLLLFPLPLLAALPPLFHLQKHYRSFFNQRFSTDILPQTTSREVEKGVWAGEGPS